MFLDYNDFIFESHSSPVEKAEHLMGKYEELRNVLQDCVDGKYAKINIIETAGADSYVTVATNSGVPYSEVFNTTDPKIALLSIVIDNTEKTNHKEIMQYLQVEDSLVQYSVFPGNRKMTDEEMEAKFSALYDDPSTHVPLFTDGTQAPIQHSY